MIFTVIGLLAAISAPIFILGLLFKRFRKSAAIGLSITVIAFAGCVYLDPRPSRSKGDQLVAVEPKQTRNEPRFPANTIEPEAAAVLNPAFKDDYGSRWQLEANKDVPLSAAGYPIIGVVKPTPVCANPFQLQLAMDLMVAGQVEKVSSVSSCLVLEEGMRAEWVKPNVLNKGYIEIRLPVPAGVPLTVYGPSRDGPSELPFSAWFGTLRRM